MSAHLKHAIEVQDFDDFMKTAPEKYFIAPSGRLLPYSTPWHAPYSLRRTPIPSQILRIDPDPDIYCQACGRLPRNRLLVAVKHNLVEGELWVCRLCALKLNHADPAAIEEEDKRHPDYYERKRYFSVFRDKSNWSMDGKAIVFQYGGIIARFTRDAFPKWRWDVDGPCFHEYDIEEDLETALIVGGYAFMDNERITMRQLESQAEERHAIACEVAQLDWFAEVFGDDKASTSRALVVCG